MNPDKCFREMMDELDERLRKMYIRIDKDVDVHYCFDIREKSLGIKTYRLNCTNRIEGYIRQKYRINIELFIRIQPEIIGVFYKNNKWKRSDKELDVEVLINPRGNDIDEEKLKSECTELIRKQITEVVNICDELYNKNKHYLEPEV